MTRITSKKGFLLFFLFRCGEWYEHQLGLKFAFWKCMHSLCLTEQFCVLHYS